MAEADGIRGRLLHLYGEAICNALTDDADQPVTEVPARVVDTIMRVKKIRDRFGGPEEFTPTIIALLIELADLRKELLDKFTMSVPADKPLPRPRPRGRPRKKLVPLGEGVCDGD